MTPKDQKPREWWIGTSEQEPFHRGVAFSHKPVDEYLKYYHVVEYSALKEAKAQLDEAIEVIEFYAKGKQVDVPNVRNEFGCACCAGTNDADGQCDFDRNVVGLTARDFLAKYKTASSDQGREEGDEVATGRKGE